MSSSTKTAFSSTNLISSSSPESEADAVPLKRLRLPLSLLVLGVLVLFTLGKLLAVPYVGFKRHATTGEVGKIYVQSSAGPELMTGDRLLRIGDTTWEDFRNDRRTRPFPSVEPGTEVILRVQRGDQILTIPWIMVGPNGEEISDRFALIWTPYIFWLMGTIALYAAVPWDDRRKMYVVLTFLTAVWLISGLVSSNKILLSSTILHMTSWLSVPVYWHFHWVFPQPLARFPRRLFGTVYALAAVLAVLEWFEILYRTAFLVGMLLALSGSLLLLITHVTLNRDQRRDLGALALAVGIALTPAILAVLTNLTGDLPWAGTSALLTVPAIPVAYYYAAFGQIGSGVKTRANRTVTLLMFAAFVYALFFVGVMAAQAWEPTSGRDVPLVMDLSVMVGLLTAIAYPGFQSLVERRLLGITIHPEQVLENYSTRITTSLERDRLVALLRDEVLPSLLIRQAVLVLAPNGSAGLTSSHSLERLLNIGVPLQQEPSREQFVELQAAAGRLRSPVQAGSPTPSCAWARLVLRLDAAGQNLGLLMLGRRDLGSVYNPSEVPAFQALADQTALALINIHQAEQLRALYQHDIHRQEVEQQRLAHELHDQVLNQLAVLANRMDERLFTPELEQAYHETVASIRDMINGLRPTMLNYGLYPGLQELVDELQQQANIRQPAGTPIQISLDVPATLERYPLDVELHLFRIIQQAGYNTLHHARATTLIITGQLVPDQVTLAVVDNGTGFDVKGPLDLTALLAGKHYGLAGMHERAAIIGAELQIHSAPGQGTKVTIHWQNSG